MNPSNNSIRVNHRIRALEVRVIDEKGGQIGILPISQALRTASERGLDLVEISPEAKPPVCRIVDFGKFRYEQAKKHKGDAKSTHASKLKELKFHINIGENDYAIKIQHATDFLKKGMRVKVSLFFRGREMVRQEYGMQLMKRAIEDLSPFGHTDTQPRLLGKNLHVILVPGKAKPKAPPAESASAPSPDQNKSFGNTLKIDLNTTGKS